MKGVPMIVRHNSPEGTVETAGYLFPADRVTADCACVDLRALGVAWARPDETMPALIVEVGFGTAGNFTATGHTLFSLS